MPQKRTASATQQPSDLLAAAELIVQRDEERQQQEQDDSRLERQQRKQAERQNKKRMLRSVEVIKWCVVSICTVWVISFMISIYILIQVKGKIDEVEQQVDRIRHVVTNPMATAGARVGKEFDAKLKRYFNVPETDEPEE
jgi:hypothetical protein